MKQGIGVLILLGLLFSGILMLADEGMWMPHQMKDLNLKQKGLKMDPKDLYKKDGSGLMSAVVSFGGGTGEFVSAEGLILTNHHVAFSAIQRASDKKNDYITHGFLAKNRKMEIPAKGYYADVLIAYEDVSHKFNRLMKSTLPPLKKYKKIEKLKKKLIRQAEGKHRDLRCVVKSMYSGNQLYLFKFKRIRDIRLVFAPPRSIGNFGGDIDNCMWPRHPNDLTYLRAYVSADNLGVPYNKTNIPYKPKSFFKLSLEGIQKGDFSFIMGYPGRTYRNYTHAQFVDDMEKMSDRIALYREFIAFFEKAGKNKRDVQIKYASIIKGLNNGMKNRIGKGEGFKKLGIADKKQTEEKALIDWIEREPARKRKYGGIVNRIKAFVQKNSDSDKKNELLNLLTSRYFGPKLIFQSHQICRAAIEGQKPDKKREKGFQKRDLSGLKLKVKIAERSYDLQVDQEFMVYLLKKYSRIKGIRFSPRLQEVIKQGDAAVSTYVQEIYRHTNLMDPKKRLQYLDYSPAQLKKLKDPLIDLAFDIESVLKTVRLEKKKRSQQLQDLKRVYMAARLSQKTHGIAPDANSTIRFTYGKINGYRPRDAVWYRCQTYLKGVIEKHSGKAPFDAPKRLLELYEKRDFGRYADRSGDIPACFLNETNVTGGNSGSPVLNAKGEQIGIIFDMTYESVTGDYFIIPELQRSISVDIRYVLFITEKFAGANHLIREMNL